MSNGIAYASGNRLRSVAGSQVMNTNSPICRISSGRSHFIATRFGLQNGLNWYNHCDRPFFFVHLKKAPGDVFHLSFKIAERDHPVAGTVRQGVPIALHVQPWSEFLR